MVCGEIHCVEKNEGLQAPLISPRKIDDLKGVMEGRILNLVTQYFTSVGY